MTYLEINIEYLCHVFIINVILYIINIKHNKNIIVFILVLLFIDMIFLVTLISYVK